MGFGDLFKKKEEDDFSDFGGGKDNAMGSGMGKGPGQHENMDHLGLPDDNSSDMAQPQAPFGEQMHSEDFLGADGSGKNESGFGAGSQETAARGPSPMPFDKLHSLSQTSEQFTHHTQKSDHTAPGTGLSEKVQSLEKDFQLINAKLDSIKSFMESINQRLLHIERIAEESRPKEETVRW